MNLKRPMLWLVIAVLAMAPISSALAKGPVPLRVSTPAGRTFLVTGTDARVWWEDLWANADPPEQPFACCRSPEAAGRFAGEVWAQWGKRATAIPEPYVIRGGWTGFFYPSTANSPPYLVMPLAQGGGGRRWPAWRVATERMEDIILAGASDATIEAVFRDEASSEKTESFVWPLIIAFSASATLLVIARLRIRRGAGDGAQGRGLQGFGQGRID